MQSWPKNPLIYEINTWVWLDELSRKDQHSITLASVPDAEWDYIASLGFDAVWLMGVWERSTEGIRISMANDGLLADFLRALPDFKDRDNVGSPYCVRRYAVDWYLGGPEGLAVAREKLAERGMCLLLDFVPNHVAPDHPWVREHPEYFIQGNEEDLKADPRSFVAIADRVFACGRDPYFPAWQDVLQLNAFDQGLRSAVIETLSTIAGQCDGVRCDMAMLHRPRGGAALEFDRNQGTTQQVSRCRRSGAARRTARVARPSPSPPGEPDDCPSGAVPGVRRRHSTPRLGYPEGASPT